LGLSSHPPLAPGSDALVLLARNPTGNLWLAIAILIHGHWHVRDGTGTLVGRSETVGETVSA